MSSRTTVSEQEFVFTRVYEAPRRLVFQAWTDPKQVAQWWGPHGFTNPVCELDMRPGGAIRIDMRGPDGTVYPMTGVYREVVEPERLAFTSAALDGGGRPLFEVLNTVTFAEHGGRTTQTSTARVVKTSAGAAQYLEGMEAGWTQTLERLEAHLAKWNGHVVYYDKKIIWLPVKIVKHFLYCPATFIHKSVRKKKFSTY